MYTLYIYYKMHGEWLQVHVHDCIYLSLSKTILNWDIVPSVLKWDNVTNLGDLIFLSSFLKIHSTKNEWFI